MTRAWLVAVLVIAACGGKAAPPPVQSSCPVGPRLLTSDEFEDMGRRFRECTDQACRDAVEAEYEDAAIMFSEMKRLASKYSDGQGSKALQELRALDEAACRCTTADCADAIQDDFDEWAMRHSDTKGSQAEADEAGKIAQHLSECMVRAYRATP